MSEEIVETDVSEVSVPDVGDAAEAPEANAPDASEIAGAQVIDPTKSYVYEHDGQTYEITGAQYRQMAQTGAQAMLKAQQEAAAAEVETPEPPVGEDGEIDQTAMLKQQMAEMQAKFDAKIQEMNVNQGRQSIENELKTLTKESGVVSYIKSLPEGENLAKSFQQEVLSHAQYNNMSVADAFKAKEAERSALAGAPIKSYLEGRLQDASTAPPGVGGRSPKPEKPFTSKDFKSGAIRESVKANFDSLFTS